MRCFNWPAYFSYMQCLCICHERLHVPTKGQGGGGLVEMPAARHQAAAAVCITGATVQALTFNYKTHHLDGSGVGHAGAQGLIEGKAAEGTPIICDVRDVAAAHVAAAETPGASGRYIVSQRAPITPSFVSEVLRVRPHRVQRCPAHTCGRSAFPCKRDLSMQAGASWLVVRRGCTSAFPGLSNSRQVGPGNGSLGAHRCQPS